MLILLLPAGCAGDGPERSGTTEASSTKTTETSASQDASMEEEPSYGYTYADPSGNRLAEGEGDLPESRPVDVGLEGSPVWVVAAPMGEATVWVAVLEDGRAQALRLENGEAEPVPFSPQRLPPGSPPLVRVEGEELVAVTESAVGEGSRISVYRPDGELVAAGPFVGEGQRWRHLLAAGPFGPEGEVEIAAVLTPHIGGTVNFYGISPEDESLQITGSVPGYSSHRIDTRNLDTALAGNLDGGDGTVELLVPNDDYTSLGAVHRTQGGAQTEWRLAAGGVISTNLASVTDSGGGISVGVGREDGSLRIWP